MTVGGHRAHRDPQAADVLAPGPIECLARAQRGGDQDENRRENRHTQREPQPLGDHQTALPLRQT